MDITDGKNSWLDAIKPYLEKEALIALMIGISSGFPYAMIGATLTTRLAQDGIDKKAVTAFALAFLVYNFKFLWAWIVDGVKIPGLGRFGQRVSWMLVSACFVALALFNLAFVDPQASLLYTAYSAVLLGFAGATFDIVIDAYRIEILRPDQQGVGAGMSQYGWRIGAAGAGALALVVAARSGWEVAYLVCGLFVLPAVIAAFWGGEPERRRKALEKAKINIGEAIIGPFKEFFSRHGAWLVLLFILLHKIGDTLANLVLRLLLEDLGFSNDEIAIYDVGIGFWAFLVGIFVGGVLYAKMGLKNSVLFSLVLMMVSNFSFALLAAAGHSNWGLAAAIGFENFASGIGGVVLVAYFAALCNLQFTAAHYALISSAASIVGRFLTGTTAGTMVESMGFFNFYIFTTLIALPGIILFWMMMRSGLVDSSIGTAAKESDDIQTTVAKIT
ncbi:MAG: AmpG family muropeptide MFS transporter [Sphingomonadales bacterium]|nr:AmpG family muropeptide MFS transporter [Sphingomonadales bacterium]